jgi:Fe-S oxidoreductase
LLYSPRNKILATSLLVEAFLYEEQTRRGISIKHWQEFEDVADHCTVCHKCLSPCPVDIDFGDVSMNMRNLLRKMGQKTFRPGNALAMFFLNATNPLTINLVRTAMVGVGFKLQRLANDVLRPFAKKQTAKPRPTVGLPPIKEQVIHFINKKMPGGLPKKSARALLDIEDNDYVPIIRNPQATPSRFGDAGHVVARGCANGAATGLLVLWLPAKGQWAIRQGRENHHRQPCVVPPGCQYVELLGH